MATWNETQEQFTKVTDKLGKKIDKGILETVVALNLLGIITRQSCEGHLDWGHPYPWVDIVDKMEQKFRLHLHLASFYKGRSTDFDCMLVFQGYRLYSRGGAFSELHSEAEQRRKLKAYQAEMHAFTTFMKTLLTL